MKLDLIEILKKNFLTVLLAVGVFVWGYFQKGIENDLNNLIDQRIEEKVSDSKIINTILKSEHVQEFTDEAGREIRNKIIDDVTKKDSNKINQNAYFGKELGIRDEDVSPLMLELLKDYKHGNFATKEDLKPRRNPITNEF